MSTKALIVDRQISMIIREGYRISTDTMAEIDEMIRKEQIREEIDQIDIGMLTWLLATKWVETKLIRILIRRVRVILTIRGSFAWPSVIGRKRRQ